MAIKDDVKFLINGREVYPLPSIVVTKKIKQGVVLYLLYGLLFLNVYSGTTVKTYPIGLPIGIGNMIVAGTSNANFQNEFNTHNLINKRIQPGQTIHGMVAFSYIEYGKLEIKINERTVVENTIE